jgi:hypothetical protein
MTNIDNFLSMLAVKRLKKGGAIDDSKFSPEVRDRAVPMIMDHEGGHPSCWAAISSITGGVGMRDSAAIGSG